MHEKLLIIDFGSQVTQLIARRVREHSVYCEIHPYKKITMNFLKEFSPKALILSGGPASVTEQYSPKINADILNAGLPVLGICYGEQLICELLGGKVEPGLAREFGPAELEVTEDSPLFWNLWKTKQNYRVWMSHGDRVTALPQGFKVIAKSTGAPFAAVANEEKKIYGVQFHPEVTHTLDGSGLIKNFLVQIAKMKGDWTMGSFVEEAIQKVQTEVGQKQVVCAVSGGVDSTVVAVLLHRALGKQVHPIFVNTGLLRKDEAEGVQQLFREHLNVPLHYIDASVEFLSLLKDVDDPEKKRKIIGKAFIDIFEREAKKIAGAEFLAQGTLYPDVIESVSVHGDAAVTIKSHHNVGGLPERMNMKLIEPVRELFKDEVRALGRALGIPEAMIKRHPFPGPGLAIRIPGVITEEKVAILQEADAIYREEIERAGLYDAIWQAFAVLLPVKTVGVMGDSRTYEYVCALRAVTSTDGMTADYFDFSHAFLRQVSTRIINHVRGINRVVYDITPKPPGTIEWE